MSDVYESKSSHENEIYAKNTSSNLLAPKAQTDPAQLSQLRLKVCVTNHV